MQQPVAEEEQNAKQQDAQTQHKQRSMLEHHSNLIEIALAVTPRDKDLYAHGKAHRQGGKDKIIQASHHGGTQLDGAEVPQESGVGEGDDGLRQVTQHDGVSDAPDLAVRNGSFNHAAKLGISWICFAKKYEILTDVESSIST